MARDPNVVVLGEDVGRDGGVFRVTEGLLDEFGESRVIDTPLAESGILGTSIGMALAGLRPVAEMQFCGFSYLMVHQWESNATRYRSRTQGQHTCPLVVRIPYGGGIRALEHHSESREAIWAHMPGGKVVIPSGPRNARALLAAAIRDPDPVIFMEPKHSYRSFREDVPDEPEVLPIGKAQVVQTGDDVTVIAWGAMMRPTLKAVQEVGREHRGHRPALDPAAGQRHHRGVGQEDRPLRGGPGGAAQLRPVVGDRRAPQRRGADVAGGAGEAADRLRRRDALLRTREELHPAGGPHRPRDPRDPGLLAGGGRRVRVQAPRPR